MVHTHYKTKFLKWDKQTLLVQNSYFFCYLFLYLVIKRLQKFIFWGFGSQFEDLSQREDNFSLNKGKICRGSKHIKQHLNP